MQFAASILEWIDFGKVSAERDDLLSEYFYDNGVLKRVIQSPSSFLILGRKGAGKTAVFRHLTENKELYIDKEDILVALQFDDYNWSVHSLLANEQKAPSLVYKESWRLVILVECMKAYSIWLKERSRYITPEFKLAEKLIQKLFGSPIPSLMSIIGSKILDLTSFKLPSITTGGSIEDIELSAGEITFERAQAEPSLRATLSENVAQIIRVLERALSSIPQGSAKVYICFDRVDEAWDRESYNASSRVIAGLVTAGESINFDFKCRIRPIIFLREDIFDTISLNDANKLREDCGALLHWKAETLSNMVLKRVNYYAKKRGGCEFSSIDEMFDKAEMRQRAKPFRYILRRTMMRPRDIISLLNKVVLSMKEEQENSFGEGAGVKSKLECDSIYSAESGYSEWLLKELEDEWGTQKPELQEILSAIRNNGSTNINTTHLNEQLVKLGHNYTLVDAINFMKFLFENSIIGFKLGDSTEWRFRCYYPTQGFVESDEYRIHEGLVRALNLTETRNRDGH